MNTQPYYTTQGCFVALQPEIHKKFTSLIVVAPYRPEKRTEFMGAVGAVEPVGCAWQVCLCGVALAISQRESYCMRKVLQPDEQGNL